MNQHQHHTSSAMRRLVSARILAGVVYCSLLLWCSGIAWIVLHYFFPTVSEFGSTPNPWEPTVIRVHGVLALLTIFLLGWIGSTHVSLRWHQWRTHLHGPIMVVIAIALAITGYALYYVVDDAPRHAVSVTHEVIGALAIIAALMHFRKRSSNKPHH